MCSYDFYGFFMLLLWQHRRRHWSHDFCHRKYRKVRSVPSGDKPRPMCASWIGHYYGFKMSTISKTTRQCLKQENKTFYNKDNLKCLERHISQGDMKQTVQHIVWNRTMNTNLGVQKISAQDNVVKTCDMSRQWQKPSGTSSWDSWRSWGQGQTAWFLDARHGMRWAVKQPGSERRSASKMSIGHPFLILSSPTSI